MSEMGYREKCISQKGEFCHVCEAANGVRVHHIDGNRDNNSIENLIPLCRTCHAKVHTKAAQSPEIDELTEQLETESYLDTESDSENTITSISVDDETRDKLRARKTGNDTYDDVVRQLLSDTDA